MLLLRKHVWATWFSCPSSCVWFVQVSRVRRLGSDSGNAIVAATGDLLMNCAMGSETGSVLSVGELQQRFQVMIGEAREASLIPNDVRAAGGTRAVAVHC